MWKLIIIDDEENISYLHLKSTECMKKIQATLEEYGLLVKLSSDYE